MGWGIFLRRGSGWYKGEEKGILPKEKEGIAQDGEGTQLNDGLDKMPTWWVRS